MWWHKWKNVKAFLCVDLVCIALICVCNTTACKSTAACNCEVNHWVEAALGIVCVVAYTVIPMLACHPEIFFPVSTCFALVVGSPLSESRNTSLLELVPRSLINMLCSIATETVNTVLPNPLWKPGWKVACYCVWFTVFCDLLIICTFLSPLCFEDRRNCNILCLLCSEVGKSAEWHCKITAGTLCISGKTAANPVIAPPFAPVFFWCFIVNVVVYFTYICELVFEV